MEAGRGQTNTDASHKTEETEQGLSFKTEEGQILYNEDNSPKEITIGDTDYIKKNLYRTLQRRVFLLETYMNSVREQIDSVKFLLEEVKNG